MIFIDRSMTKPIALALQHVRKDVIWLEDRFPHDTPDVTWLRAAGEEDWLVITRDKGIRHKPAEIRMVREASVGYFTVGEKNDLSRWNLLRIVVTNLEHMITLHSAVPKPFIYLIDAYGRFNTVPLT